MKLGGEERDKDGEELCGEKKNVTKMYCLCNCYGHERGVWSYIHNSLSTDF